jgi:hypothetical protein
MARALETVVPNWYIELRQSQWSKRQGEIDGGHWLKSV